MLIHSPIRRYMRNMLLDDSVSWQNDDLDIVEAKHLESLNLLEINRKKRFGTVYYTGTKTKLGCEVAKSPYIQEDDKWNSIQDNFKTKFGLFRHIIEEVKKEKLNGNGKS